MIGPRLRDLIAASFDTVAVILAVAGLTLLVIGALSLIGGP